MGYGLWEFGEGTGNYRPESPTTRKENDILKSAIKHVKARFDKSMVILKMHGSGYQRSGIPDLYIQLNGIPIWVEFKRPGADTTALQKGKLEQLKAAGAYCGTAASEVGLEMLIENAIIEFDINT